MKKQDNYLPKKLAKLLPITFYNLSNIEHLQPKQHLVVDRNSDFVKNDFYKTNKFKIEEHWKPISKVIIVKK